MNADEVVQLLLVIAAYDNRPLTPEAELTWGQAAHDGRWAFPAAVAAVHRFFATPLEPTARRPWLDPGHVTYLIRVMRPGGMGPAPVSEVRSLPAAPPASAERREAVRRRIAEHIESTRRGRGEEPLPAPESRRRSVMPRPAEDERPVSGDEVAQAKAAFARMVGGAQGRSAGFGSSGG